MSAQPAHNDDNLVSIEIDGKTLQAPKGSMIIQAADNAGIPIPRFCYHSKLSIAANCRMCLVEVEMNGKPMPKPQPACATPVGEGMKISTQSGAALKAQRNVMEFLLINHPLDCPVCDQGGECELQDIALGYGRGVSRFTERKRSVADEDIGPLVATEMTRCIHCTRCVRFLGEIAGTDELGSMNRGEHLEIGTYIGKSINSELSGNIIDVCPVGALTNKPFQFRARAWELIAKPSIGYHDALGSNLWLHTRRGEVLRTVPRENEDVNECWLSDRDRYSNAGLYADDRALRPMVRRDGELVETSWDDAITAAAAGLKNTDAGQLGALLAPLASAEEGFLLGKLVRGLGSDNIDHRLRVQDFSDRAAGATFEMPVAELNKVGAALVIGSDLRYELPLVNHRLRQASRGMRMGAGEAGRVRFDVTTPADVAKVFAINPAHFDFNYELAGETVVAPQALVDVLLGVAAAAGDVLGPVDDRALSEAIGSAQADEAAHAMFAALRDAEKSVVLLGDVAAQHPQAAWLRALARLVARATGSAFNEVPAGANAVGLARAGALPQADGADAARLLAEPPKRLLIYHAGSQDTARPDAFDRARTAAGFCLYMGAYTCHGVQRTADVVLPIGLPPEIDGSYVNVDGRVQVVRAGARAPGEARPGWKVLRALGAALGLDGFEFADIDQLRAAMGDVLAKAAPLPKRDLPPRAPAVAAGSLVRLATVPIYRSDAVVRRTSALQAHPLNRMPALRINADEAARLGLAEGDEARIGEATLPVVVDAAVPAGGAWIEAGHKVTAALPPYGATLNVSKA